MSNEDLKALFDGFDPAEHEDEVRERWGDDERYRESQRRTRRYRREDWEAIKAEGKAVEGKLAELFLAGVAPDHPSATAAAEAHRAMISRWFYECSPEMHRGLGEMYIADPRFAAHYDRLAPGLSQYVRDAIVALHR